MIAILSLLLLSFLIYAGIWGVLTEVVAALQHAEVAVRRQWLIDAVEISCVSTYPSTVGIYNIFPFIVEIDNFFQFLVLKSVASSKSFHLCSWYLVPDMM